MLSGDSQSFFKEIDGFPPYIGPAPSAALENVETMIGAIKEMIEAGKVRPVIDRTYPFTETAEAMRYLETGHARAKVVITV